MNSRREHQMDPALEELLTELSVDPQSTLLRVPVASGALNAPHTSERAANLLAAERELLSVFRYELRDLLLEGIRGGIPDVTVNGPADLEKKLSGNLSLSFKDVDGSALIVSLGDLAASAGSACTAGNAEPSYVLKAIGTPMELAVSTLRLGLGRFTTEEDVSYATGRFVETVGKLRSVR